MGTGLETHQRRVHGPQVFAGRNANEPTVVRGKQGQNWGAAWRDRQQGHQRNVWVNWPTAAHSRECLAVCIKIAVSVGAVTVGRHNSLTTSCEGHPQRSLRAGPVSAARLCVHSAVLSNNLVRPASGTATLWPGVPLGAERGM